LALITANLAEKRDAPEHDRSSFNIFLWSVRTAHINYTILLINHLEDISRSKIPQYVELTVALKVTLAVGVQRPMERELKVKFVVPGIGTGTTSSVGLAQWG
jgi:hypothetical protein